MVRTRLSSDEKPSWPGQVTGLSLALISGLVVDRVFVFLNWPVSHLARLANGMEPLPYSWDAVLRVATKFPSDWWITAVCAAVVSIACLFVIAAWFPARKTFWITFVTLFAVMFVAFGHLPVSGFREFGPAHYSINKAAFLAEVLSSTAASWYATKLGVYLMRDKQ